MKRVLNGMATIHAARFVAYEKELEAARLEAQQLRILCVVQRLAYIQMTVPVLRDAVAFIDRLGQSKGDWTTAEVRRLAEIRALAKGL